MVPNARRIAACPPPFPLSFWRVLRLPGRPCGCCCCCCLLQTLEVDLGRAAQVALLPPLAAIAASAVAGPSADALIARGVPVATVR